MTIFHKLLDTKAKVDDATRTVEVICSTSAPDRIGDVIVQDGINTTRYKQNPVVLWGHDADRPVARAEKVFLQNGQLRAVASFPPAGEDADSDWVYGKIKNNLVNAVSIGFIPREWEPCDPKNPWDGYKYLESEMVEFSFVSVPMNAEALIVGRSLQIPNKRDFMLPSRRKDAAGDSGQHDPNSQLTTEDPDGAKPDLSWESHAAKGMDIHDHGDGEYDAAGCTKAMMEGCSFGSDEADHAQLRKGFLLHDPQNVEKRKSYKLPFGNFIDGKMVADKAGLEHAAGKLARTDGIDENVRKKAMGVVDHYRDRLASEGKALIIREADDWKVCGARDLPIDESDSWDGPAAAASMFEAAGMDGDKPDLAMVRRGFLICDASHPELKGSYKLPFAHVSGGSLKAVKGGIRAAASRLMQTDAPEDVLNRAKGIIDHYEEKMGMHSDDGKALVMAVRRSFEALGEALARAQKAGRTLNAANEARIRDAHTSLSEVLDQLPPLNGDTTDDASKALASAAANARTRQSSASGRTDAQRFPKRAQRQAKLLKLRSA